MVTQAVTHPVAIARKPVIWTVSVSRLSNLLRDVTPEYDDRAFIEPLNLGFEEAVKHMRKRLRDSHCDVLIAAGSNGAYLKSRVAVPVVLVKASGFDLMQALSRARQITDRIGIVTHQTELTEFAQFQKSYGLQIEQRVFVTAEDARHAVSELVARGIKAIVGTGMVTDLAEQAGIAGILLYSAESIRAAFDAALDIAHMVGNARSAAEAKEKQEEPNAKAVIANAQAAEARKANCRVRRVRYGSDDWVGHSAIMRQVRDTLAHYARTDATVLIQGETGTGKELAAQTLHEQSNRASQPFVAINCGAIAESLLESELFGHEEGAFTGARRGGHMGLIEAANGGTLFLDEIGEMPLPLQTRLLRVLEEREVVRVGSASPHPVDVRIVTATHCVLDDMVQQGRFRRDLFYRLNVLRLQLPALRDRADDIVPLMQHFLDRPDHAPLLLDSSAWTLLKRHNWPGNVRELKNIAERLHTLFQGQASQGSDDSDFPGGARLITATMLQATVPELSPQPNPYSDGQPTTQTVASPLNAAMPNPPATNPPSPPQSPPRKTRKPPLAQLQQQLQTLQGDRAALCQQLGISRATLWRWLSQDAGE
ncbi:propionate catabolism operon regulatory protein PrpR [Ampullimonas aquatilis]|uniref:propionate catabolism operon regulatory protein PrpR n=1 Tax=Ampullimonas aquatilis TaxID=1341549 RepID=UPI003C77301A